MHIRTLMPRATSNKIIKLAINRVANEAHHDPGMRRP